MKIKRREMVRMRPDEYYKKELIKRCDDIIKEMQQNKKKYYKDEISKLLNHVFPTCRMNYEKMEIDDRKGLEFRYEKSRYMKSRNSVQHIFYLDEYKIKGTDSFIFYPEISQKDNDVIGFKADYIEKQISSIKNNIQSFIEEYNNKIKEYRDIRKSLQYDFEEEKIPELYRMFNENQAVDAEVEGNLPISELIESYKTAVEENSCNEEYETQEYIESYDGGYGDFDEPDFSEEIESPQFSEIDYNEMNDSALSELCYDAPEAEMVETECSEADIRELGFTEKLNKAIEKSDEAKRKRYGVFSFMNVG